jgi:hypothetical protein
MNRFAVLALTFTLTACSSGDNAVRVTNDQPVAKPVAPGRTEPIFYNGKTYKLAFAPADGGGGYTVLISGMSASQQSDAQGLTSSAFHHFYCKDSQKAKILNAPAYSGGKWNSFAQCV